MNFSHQSIQHWLDLQKLERTINQKLSQALAQGVHPVTLNEFYVLHYLHQTKGKELRVNEISDKLGMSFSGTSRMLQKFEESCQVIERKTSSQDQRAIEISLTPLGLEVLSDCYSKVEQVIKQYQTLLSKLTQAIQELE